MRDKTNPGEELLRLAIELARKTQNMTEDEFRAFLEADGYHNVRRLQDGTWIALGPLAFTTGLYIGMDSVGWDRRYDYKDKARALSELRQLERGDQEPSGWIDKRPEFR